MASRTLPGIGLNGFWTLGEDGWKTGADENWRKLSALTQLTVKSAVTALPGSPTNGDIYIVPSGGEANNIAVRDNGSWVYFTPTEGWKAWAQDENATYVFNGTSWVNSDLRFATISLFAAGTMGDAEKLTVYLATAAMTIPVGATGSLAHSEVTAAAATSLPISKVSGGSTTSVGSIDFALGAAAGTFTVASPISLAIGDRLIIAAPATADLSLADVSISIKGTLA